MAPALGLDFISKMVRYSFVADTCSDAPNLSSARDRSETMIVMQEGIFVRGELELDGSVLSAGIVELVLE